MAVRLQKKRDLKCLEIYSETDDAIDFEESDWEEYQKEYDPKHLVFVPNMQATKFVVNFELTGKQSARVKNSMIGAADREEGVKIALGDWAFRVVKYTLKEIKNPDDISDEEKLELKKDKDGYVHDNTLVVLDRMGIVQEIFNAYQTLVNRGARAQSKN